MKITHTIIFALALILIANDSRAQEYIRINQNQLIYDVDVVVFGRRLAQPTLATFNNAPLVKTEDVRTLSPLNPELELFKYPAPESPPSSETADDQWQVPIKEMPKYVDVLSWVLMDSNSNHPMIQRLAVNPNLKPLMHQQWRQPATPFLRPEYVEMTQLETQPIPTETNGSIGMNNTMFSTKQMNADYSIDGQVAFSSQKYTHLHVKMNLFRINADGEQIIHNMVQQRRIELGKWQYFDHPQFGVLAKVTAVKIPQHETSGE